LASDGEGGDNFGFSVAINDKYAIVGAKNDDSNKGSSYIFEYNGTAWTQKQKLLASDGEGGDNFCNSIAMNLNYVIIGGYGSDSFKGSAYVFKIFDSEINTYDLIVNNNVGIGINDPSEKLEIKGGIKIENALQDSAGTIRYTSTNGFEGYHENQWSSLAGKSELATEFSDGLMSSKDKKSLNKLVQGGFQDKISTRFYHFFHILDTGEVMGCGRGSNGEIGREEYGFNGHQDRLVPVKITGNYNGRNAIKVSSGSITAVILNTGEVMATGRNSSGELGLGDDYNAYSKIYKLTSLAHSGNYNGRNATAVSAGYKYMCVLLDTGEVMACGYNNQGQLGIGSYGENQNSLVPMQHSGNYDGTNAVAISASQYHTVVLLKSGEVMACGSDEFGKLGAPWIESIDSSTYINPTLISMNISPPYNGSNAIAIATSTYHTHILLNTGVIMTCGKDEYNKFGRVNGPLDGGTHLLAPMDTSSNGVPSPYQGNAVAITCGNHHLAALLSDNSVVTVGAGNDGTLGNGEPGTSQTPHVIPNHVSTTSIYNGKNAIAIASGTKSLYILTEKGEIVACGDNAYNHLGINTTSALSTIGTLTPLHKNGNYTGVSVYDVNLNIKSNILASIGQESSIENLNDILDVSFNKNDLSQDDILKWDANNNKWIGGDAPSTFSGSYNDLTNKPIIPTNNNQLINGAGFVTQSDIDTAIANVGSGGGSGSGNGVSLVPTTAQTSDLSANRPFPNNHTGTGKEGDLIYDVSKNKFYEASNSKE
ncbi:MAG: hypothetical protein OXF77_03060, partial [Thaumarchaeota archaeon]|nr:hypothetical protein [Nitrososphaerota archaeon]